MASKKLNNMFSMLKTGVIDKVSSMAKPYFEPTGAMEPVISLIGNTKAITTIVNLQCNNKSGKSAIGAATCGNIIWEHDPIYFNFDMYRAWPFLVEGKPIKRIRIVGTSKNVSDAGPIREEILKWWPAGRYKCYKDSQRYYSKYETDNGWLIDVMTFDQAPKDFEGSLIAFHWIDEPAKPDLMGAFMSRHMKGGILLFTQTPEGAGPMLDIMSDLKDKGFPVLKVTSNIYENSITSGKLNSTGTKRGLMTDPEIDSYVKSIPADQQESRIWGRGSEKEGKIYKKFNPDVHVRDFDIFDDRFLKANCYCALDIHDKYYPFLTWWAIFPPNNIGKCYHVCYNEWPTFETFNDYYDNVRSSLEFNKTIKELSAIIKIQDRTALGYNIVRRGIDPGAAKKSEVQLQFAAEKLIFDVPKREKIETQRNQILTLMDYDATLTINIYTEPSWYITPNCKNMIRATSRHYWEDKDGRNRSHNRSVEVEAERYKDPIDTARIFESLVGNNEYFVIVPKSLKRVEKFKPISSTAQRYLKNLPDVSLYSAQG